MKFYKAMGYPLNKKSEIKKGTVMDSNSFTVYATTPKTKATKNKKS